MLLNLPIMLFRNAQKFHLLCFQLCCRFTTDYAIYSRVLTVHRSYHKYHVYNTLHLHA